MNAVKKIFLILILVLLAFVVYRYVVLKKNQEEGSSTPITFRDFFNLGDKSYPGSEGGDVPIIPIFENEGLGTGGTAGGGNTTPGGGGSSGSGGEGTGTPGTASAFGDAPPFEPGGSFGAGGSLGSGGDFGDGSPFGNNTGNTGQSGSGSSGGGLTTPTGPICSAKDTDIVFTDEENARLQVLEARFNAIAPTLITDQGVVIENGNYQTYKSKNDKIVEYRNFCFERAPLLADAALKRRLPTPYWSDSTLNRATFASDATSVPTRPSVPRTPARNSGTDAFIEKLFRLNIW